MELNNIYSQVKQRCGIVRFLFLIFIITACTEDPLKISPDILPDDHMLDALVDTLPVELYTIGTDAAETQSIATGLLGSVNDPVMGILETDFLADFIYSDEPTFKNQTDFDSVRIIDLVIDLVYSTQYVYGDLLNASSLNFNVYELLEPMPQYSKSDYVILPHMYNPAPLNTDSWFISRTSDAFNDVVDTCQIILDHSFAERFLDTVLINDEIYYSENQQQFKEHFKGFYFAVEPRASEGGAIILFDRKSTIMTLRYEEWVESDDSLVLDTIYNYFTVGNPTSAIDSGGLQLNLYRNSMSAGVANAYNDTLNYLNRAYIQAPTGPQVFVKLPTLPAFRDSFGNSISVVQAQLVLPVDMESYDRDKDRFFPPHRLGLLDGVSKTPLFDDQWAENHLWGYIDTTYSDSHRYILNIGNHINYYLHDETLELSNSFYLFAAGPDTKTTVQYLKDRPVRIVLNGNTELNKPFVRIIYSKIP